MESKTLPTEMEQHADENQDTICFDWCEQFSTSPMGHGAQNHIKTMLVS